MKALTPDGLIDLSEDDISSQQELVNQIPLRKASFNRDIRNTILSQSDWTQMPDSALTDEAKALWVTYRTALRDLPAHDNWPNLEDADWPTAP